MYHCLQNLKIISVFNCIEIRNYNSVMHVLINTYTDQQASDEKMVLGNNLNQVKHLSKVAAYLWNTYYMVYNGISLCIDLLIVNILVLKTNI